MTVAGKKTALKTAAGPNGPNIQVISFHVPLGPQNSAVPQRVLAATKIVPIISVCNVEMTMGAEIKAIEMDKGLKPNKTICIEEFVCFQGVLNLTQT